MDPDAQVYYNDEDKWTEFTKELINITQTNWTPIFERMQRIPLNISNDIGNFPVCPDI